MFASIFFFILVNNFVGLIPGMTPATDNLNTTIGVGLFSFVIYNFYGIKENGLSYLKHFFGPVLWLAPLMLAIELVSHAIRPLTLGLRLQGNILADHTILGVFVDMFSSVWFIPVPAIFYGMGIFVSGMQAFVFTMLSMIYISMAIAHDH
jgi:F-type H+-transporting ATPase subunit a